MATHPVGRKQTHVAFTLSELLIALAVIGLLATFTIPKLLQANMAQKQNAAAKQALAMVHGAYDAYKVNNLTVPETFKLDDLLPYMNYVGRKTSGRVDDHPNIGGWHGNGGYNCGSSGITCLRLHTGGVLFWVKDQTFGGTTPLNAIWLLYDPDEVATETTADSISKAVCFFFYYDGSSRSRKQIKVGSIAGNQVRAPNSTFDPSWFSW